MAYFHPTLHPVIQGLLITSAIIIACEAPSVARTPLPQPPGNTRLGQQKEFTISSGVQVKGQKYVRQPLIMKGSKTDAVSNLIVDNIEMDHSGPLFAAFMAGQSLSDARFSRIRSVEAQSGLLRFRGPIHNLLIEDIELHITAVNQDPKKVPFGIALAGKTSADTGSEIIIRNAIISGAKSAHEGYRNGDGIATERGYSNIRLENITSSDNSDAGFDLKSSDTIGRNLTAERNQRNFKLWYGQSFDGPITSIDPGGVGSARPAHIALCGKKDGSSVFSFAHINFRATTPVPLIDIGERCGKVRVIIKSYSLNVPKDTPKLSGAINLASVEWGTEIPVDKGAR
ncbi:MAG: hypothetical protein E2598_01300 [Sphingobium sp.]|nr:hypothetical protein [Sphingobium sp.]